MYYLGKSTLLNMVGVDYTIVKIVHRAIEITKTDFGVLKTGGYRSAKMQSKIYSQGHSKCDGYIKKSYHQSGNAIDLVPYVNGSYTWNNKNAMFDVYVAFVEAERQLREEGQIPDTVFFHHGILWHWKDLNNNNVFDIEDKFGWDCAHHEKRSSKQKF